MKPQDQSVSRHSPSGVSEVLRRALEHHRAGRFDEAERIYREILAAQPDQPDCLHLLGLIEYQRGRTDAAVDLIHCAIAVKAQPAYLSNLGGILQAQGRLEEAAECFARTLALNPDWAEVHTNFGNVLQAQNKFEEAAAHHNRALELKPDFAEAWSNLGNARQAQGDPAGAVPLYERALALKPDYADAHNNLGNALATLKRTEEAVVHYERALALRPAFAYAHNNLGNALLSQERIEEARMHYEQALALNPAYANAHQNLGNLYKQLGQFEDAMAHYGQAIAIRPDYAEAHYSRAELKSFRAGDPDLAHLEALAARNDLTDEQAIYLHFSLAKALGEAGDHAGAWEHLRLGNALKRAQIHYDEASALHLFERIAAAFDSGLWEKFRAKGDPSEIPVFVVGMPRSGSTLVEQILASHPQIQAAGELPTLERMITGDVLHIRDRTLPYPECIATLDDASLLELGRTYLSALPTAGGGKLRIVDKLPGNFLHLGLIRLMLPNARMIHTRRDAVATCVSCYSKLFTSGLPFTYDLVELGRYYRAYDKLMAHWRRTLPPGAMLEVSYEDVVSDLETQARRLIDYCGLAWDDRCIRFHETRRPIKTASAVQVRKPLFRTSLDRWKNYESGLTPLLDQLRRP